MDELFANEVAMYRSVGMHPDYRRRGICGTLVFHAGNYALDTCKVDTLVMVADEHYHAAKINESVGFMPTEKSGGVLVQERYALKTIEQHPSGLGDFAGERQRSRGKMDSQTLNLEVSLGGAMSDDSNTYEVVISGGRGGHIIYREARGELQFWWEYVSSGVFVKIPNEAEWKQACTAQGAPWATGRRDQVLKRVLEKLGGAEARDIGPEPQVDGILFRIRPRP